MGVEVVGSEVIQVPVENGFNGTVHEVGNENFDLGADHTEPIKFGSNGDDLVEAEGDNASDTNVPTNAAEEWPVPKKTHSFYFIRYRQYDDPKIKAKIDLADKEVKKRNLRRFELIDALRAKRSDRAFVINQLKELNGKGREFKSSVDEKRKEMGPLQQALGQLRNNNGGGRGAMICSSEEELDAVIHSLKYRIQHESIPLTEEKQILREIKQLEGTRDKVIANAAMRMKIQDEKGQKADIQDQVKLMSVGLDGLRKQQQAISGQIKDIEDTKKALEKEIEALEKELDIATEKRDEAYQTIQVLRQQRVDGNICFYQNRDVLSKVKALGLEKNIQALEELAHAETEKFMTNWCTSKAFRDDYEKRILASLDSRQMSRDGRMRNPDEKLLVVTEAPKPLEPETLAKANVKRLKEESKPAAQQDTLPTQKISKEATSKSADSRTSSKHNDVANEEIYELENTQGPPSVKNEADVTKSKEMIREEEIAKAKLAMERKKKLAEKAAAKAAIRAQKEAEKKLKDREKKAKKKATTSVPASDTNSEEPAETVEEPAEPEKVEASVETPVSAKVKVQKEKSIRYRTRGKGPESLPKVILKRKKSANYWVWAIPAVMVVLMFIALGYHYLL